MQLIKKKNDIKEPVQQKKVEITVRFIRGKENSIIGKLESGKIALISNDCENIGVCDGEDWMCAVVRDGIKSCIIEPLYILRTKEENDQIFSEGLKKLKTQGIQNSTNPPKQKNATLFYQTK